MKKISSFIVSGLFILAGCSISSVAISDPTIDTDYTLESKTRVSRTVFDYNYKVNITNTESTGITNVKATATSTSTDITITEGEVSFPDVAAGGTAQSSDTFTIRKDRNVVFDENAIEWNVSFTATIINPSQEPKIIVGDLQGNTVNYNSIAYFPIVLDSQPTANVTIPVSSSDENEGVTTVDSVVFTPDNWNELQNITIKGRNRNVQDNLQNYKIITGESNSLDSKYDGINPDDIEIKGLSISLQSPTLKETIFISNIEKQVSLKTNYNGSNRLFYTLTNSPSGMTINNNNGDINWNAPESDEGESHSVTVKVTDGYLSSNVTFNVSISTTNTLNIISDSKKLTVVEENHSLKGLIIESESIDLSSQKIKTISNESVPDLPLGINIVSDIFIFSNAMNGNINIKIPIPETETNQLTSYNLYAYDEEISSWYKTSLNLRYIIESNNFFLNINLVEVGDSPFFLAKEITLSQRKVMNKELRVTNDLNCILKEEEITEINNIITIEPEHYLCTYDNGLGSIIITGYYNDIWKNGDETFSAKDISMWVVSSQDLFESFGVETDSSFKIQLEELALYKEEKDQATGEVTRVLTKDCENFDSSRDGFVSPAEDFNILHINNSKCLSGSREGTAVHEYFHHAQSKITENGKNPIITELDRRKNWITEGTANWISGEKKPSLLSNRTIPRLLERGINSLPIVAFSGPDESQNPYLKYPFWKLISDSCNFKSNKSLINILSITPMGFSDFEHPDPSAINNFNSTLSSFNCDFGINDLDNTIDNKITAALIRYQYETLQKENANIGFGSTFEDTPYIYSQSDYGEVNSVGLPEDINITDITSIPAYGAFSIKTEKDTFTHANLDENHEAVLKVKPNGGSPLTVSILSSESSFIGTSYLDGNPHRFFKTDEAIEYIFSHDELIPYFITIVNPNPDAVDIEELAFEVRSKLSPELSVTSHTEEQNVNERVITVSGSVPTSASDVDRIIVSNGGIRTIVQKSSDNKFNADVVVSLGDNPLIVQGYNSSDLQTPLTKELILNLKGVEGSANTRNSLISSRVVAVLRWNTNSTDLDFYSTDKSGVTIWYQNDSVSFGFLDDDDTNGYGPEVITYRSDNSSTFLNGKFDLDVHYYGGSSNTTYYIDLILNESNSGLKRTYHYESKVPFTTPDSAQDGPSGTGISRQNNILSISCDAQQVCGDVSINTSYLKASTGFTQPIINNRLQARGVNTLTAYEQCLSNHNRVLSKKGYLSWSCDSNGRKIRH